MHAKQCVSWVAHLPVQQTFKRLEKLESGGQVGAVVKRLEMRDNWGHQVVAGD